MTPASPSDMTRYQISLDLSPQMKEALEHYCREQGYSQSYVLRVALAQLLTYDLAHDSLHQATRVPRASRPPTTTPRTRRPHAIHPPRNTPQAALQARILKALQGKERDNILRQLETILEVGT